MQTVVPLEGESSHLKLTTATYYVGKDDKKKNIHRFPDSKESDQWGVKPNDGYEVKLTDEERINYFKWRRLRDVVRQNGQTAPKVDEQDKVPADFKDRVLEKALEYIQTEQHRQGQPPAIHDAAAPARPAMSGLAFRQDPVSACPTN